MRQLTGLGPKTLLRIAGRHLLELVLSILRCAGADEVTIVAHPYWATIYEELAATIFARYTIVVNYHWWLENGYSLVLALRETPYDYAVAVMADHIVHPEIVRRVAAWRGDGAAVGCDRSPKLVDIDEATKVYSTGVQITSIGKELKHYTCIDVGVLGFKRDTVLKATSSNENLSVSGIVQTLAEKGYAEIVDVTGLPWRDIDTPQDYFDTLYGSSSGFVKELVEALNGGCYGVA